MSSRISTRVRVTTTIPAVTQTDYVTSTIFATPSYEPTSTDSTEDYGSDIYAEDIWEHRIHRFLPVILAFAIIGILTIIGSLAYLAYRFYQANRSSRQGRHRQDAETATNYADESSKKMSSPVSATLSTIIPWLSIPSPLHPTDRDNETYSDHQPVQREPIRYEKSDLNKLMKEDSSNSTIRRPSWLAKLLPKSKNAPSFHPNPRHNSLPILSVRTMIDNLNVPISSTFKPIDKSSLVLVPRSEIWSDPNRRRGVDELDIWERKKSGTTVVVEEEEEVQHPTPLMWRFPSESAYPTSPESFERRFSATRRSIHINSRHSPTTTMQDILSPQKKPSVRRSNSDSDRYNQPDDDDDDDETKNESTIASTSISYPNALNYYQEEEEDDNDQHFSNFAITVKLPKPKQQQQPEASNSSDIRLARQELERSRIQNSSSQWLHLSGSKSF